MLDPSALIYAAASNVHAAGGSTSDGLSPSDALAVSITMEGLLFAAFAVGIQLTEPTKEGRSPFYTQAWFGWSIVGVIFFLAAAAGASWWEIFGSGWPDNVGALLLGIGLALGIVTQPIFAAAINVESRKT